MTKLDALLAERRACALRYDELLEDVDGVQTPTAGPVAGHNYQSYVIRLREGGRTLRNEIMKRMAADGIQTRPGTHAVHRLGYYSTKYGLAADDFPNAAACEDTTITLPIFPGMTEHDQRRVTGILVDTLQPALHRS
jgi:dTDP-4-amino-4,6-dideoxygalactose transaminase